MDSIVNRMPKPQNQHTLNSEMDQIPLNARNKLQEGLAFHQKGKLQQAEQAYQKTQQHSCVGQKAQYLLTGILKCRHCGYNLQMKSYMPRNEAHYVCSGRRQSAAFCGNSRHYDKDRLEEIVMQEVKETILDAGYLEEYY